MPPADLLLSEFPAEIHHAPIAHVGKVTEAEIDVLDKNAQFMNGLQVGRDGLKALHIVRSHSCPAPFTGLSRGLLYFLSGLQDDRFSTLYLRQMRLEFGNELIRFEQ